MEARIDQGPAKAAVASGAEHSRASDSKGHESPQLERFDLDRLVASYGRLLLTIRTARATVAAMMIPVFTTIPDAVVSAVLEGYGVVVGIVAMVIAGVPLTLLAAGLGWLYFKVLRLVWSGSVGALWTCFLLGAIVLPWGGLGLYLDISREDLLHGRVWFRVVDYLLHSLLFALLAVGTAFIVRRRHHEDLLALLRANRRRDWRTALLQLCGVVWPPTGWRTALRDRAVGWSLLAFSLEGLALYPTGATNMSSADPLRLVAVSPDSVPPFHGHYLSLSVIVCLCVPGLFLWTQSLFRLADGARRRARRAALRHADDARRQDPRPPVLFLRSFEDDQVSLRAAPAVAAVRLVDPFFEHAHLEDALQTCLSLGPVIAVGRPTDTQPPDGVARLYVPGPRWQDVVRGLTAEAGLIVVGVADSAGLAWEIEWLTTQGYLDKTLFIVPPRDVDNTALIGDLVRRVAPLASTPERDTFEHARDTRAVAVTFAAGRTRVFVSARRLSQVQYELALRLTASHVEQQAQRRR